ncbi:MAG: helix-turn-helix transcriptional regulator, partial [Clostridiales bacterium]|nr:helix-turn-helix transcriptional regulator [Clostridiales bacterium]
LGNIAVISQLQTEDEITRDTDSVDDFCRLARRVCSVAVTAGIGHICAQLRDLNYSYQGAGTAVSYRAIYGNTRAINIGEIEPRETGDSSWEQQAIRDIIKRIKTGDGEALVGQIHQCARRFSETGTSLQKFRVFILELEAELYRMGNDSQMDMDQIFTGEKSLAEQGFQADSPEEFWSLVMEICARMQDSIARERQNTTKSFVTRAMEYVEAHYGDNNISIETVCKNLGVSAAYFSTVFKKETGKTFISYLTEYRMKQAADLLLTTDDKTYIIAEKVGYMDPNYFSYVFKKQYGIAPSRYRVEKLKERGQN